MSLSPKKLLSAASKEQCLATLKDVPAFVRNNTPETRAAVLVPLCVVDEEVCVLYTLRSLNLKSHGGQTSFPGGKQDGSETAIETALRETEEEIGLSRSDIDIWGVMSTFQGRTSDIHITPVIGLIKDFHMNKLKINADEVEEVFTVPMSSLCNLKNHGHLVFTPPLPVFIHGKHKIWGITGLITQVFLYCLLPDFKTNIESQKFRLDELMPPKL